MTKNLDGSIEIFGKNYEKKGVAINLVGKIVKIPDNVGNIPTYILASPYFDWNTASAFKKLGDYIPFSTQSEGQPIIAEAVSDNVLYVGIGTGPGVRAYGDQTVNTIAWAKYEDIKQYIKQNDIADVLQDTSIDFPTPIATYSISVADGSFKVNTLSEITDSLNDYADGVVLASDGNQYLHLNTNDCFIKLSDVTDEQDDKAGQPYHLASGSEAYTLKYSNHKYTFTDQNASIGISHPNAIMNARFVINGVQYYHTDVKGYEKNWFKS